MNRRKSLPPYGKKLLQRMMVEKYPTNGINIQCGYLAWNRAKNLFNSGCNVLLFPSNASPYQYDWTLLRGYEISVLHNPKKPGRIERNVLENLCIEIVRTGATAVGLVDPESPLQWFLPESKRAKVVWILTQSL